MAADVNFPDDAHLLAAANHGDRTAMEALIRRYAALVLTTCRRQLPAADADDAAQAVFLILWRRNASVSSQSLPGWLVVTARHVCANARRAAQRRQHAERALSAPSTPQPENEARVLLDQALASLPAVEREAVIRRHLIGEEPATVAAALGCAEGTVHSRTSRGLERLRTWFARQGIVVTSATLLVLCNEECSAAHAIEPSTVLQMPSGNAHLFAMHQTSPLLTKFGIPLMSLAALSLATLFTWTQFGAVSATVDALPDRYSKGYDVSDLYDRSVLLLRPPSAATPKGTRVVPPPVDPALLTSLDGSRRLDELVSQIKAITGGASVARLLDRGMSNEDLRFDQPAGAPDPVPWMRHMLAGQSHFALPGTALPRWLLVVGDRSAHACLEVHLRALRDLRFARVGERITTTSTTLHEKVRALYGADWFMRDQPPAPHPPLITTVAAPTGRAFTVIWLPEGVERRYSIKPLAVATDGECCLLITSVQQIWQPGILSAAIALRLRRQLDQGKLHAPLQENDWLDAVSQVTPDPWADKGDDPFADLTTLLGTSPTPTTNF